jgi:hypothetical protein
VDEPEDEIIELMAGEAGYQGPAEPEGFGAPLDMNADDEDEIVDDIAIGGDDLSDDEL